MFSHVTYTVLVDICNYVQFTFILLLKICYFVNASYHSPAKMIKKLNLPKKNGMRTLSLLGLYHLSEIFF